MPTLPIPVVAACFVLVASTFLIVFLDEATVVALTAEDAVVENYGGACFLLASLLFLLAYRRSTTLPTRVGPVRTRRNLVYLILGLMFLFAGGEEISWGQRIVGWETPEGLAAYNRQGETNLHNLVPFQGGDGQGVSLHLLFSLFWLGYCVALPLLDRIPIVRRWLAQAGMPVAPLWVGGLLLLNYVLFSAVTPGFEGDVRHGLNELKESNAAFAFALVGVLAYRRTRRVAHGPAVVRIIRTVPEGLPVRAAARGPAVGLRAGSRAPSRMAPAEPPPQNP